MSLFSWFIVRRLAQEPIRTALTVTGIGLGVAVVLAIQMANASSLSGFSAALDAVAGRTSLEIVGAGAPFDELRLRDLGWLREYGDVSPVIEGDTMLRPRPRRAAEAVRVLGIDILRDQPFREYDLLQFDEKDAAADAPSFLELLVNPDSVVLTEVLARRHGLAIGDSIELRIGDRVATFTIRGLLQHAGPARALDGNFVLMDIAAAQLAFDRLGRLDRVDVRLSVPERLDQAEREIAQRLPPGLHVQRPARRGAQVEKMLAAFHFNLTALSAVALLVGLFLVYNTVATSVIARRAEIGTLRALGASRRRVLGLFLGEAAVMALAGCALGVPLGWLLARGAVGLTASTVTTLYVAEAAGLPSMGWWQGVLAFAVGVPLALAAAGGPALEAAGISPLQALRGAAAAEARARPRLRSLLAALACLALAGLLARMGPIGGLPVFGVLSALAVVFGLALAVPAALWGLGRLGQRPLTRLLGVEGRLAHGSLVGSIPRLSVSVAALAVSLAMLVAIAVMIGSFRETVIYWVGQTLQADLYISTARRSNIEAQGTISAELERVVVADPAVVAVDRFRNLSLPYQDRLIVLGAGEFDVLLDHGSLAFKAPANAAAAMRAAIGRDAVVASESFALRFGRGPGDTVRLPTPSGERPFRIAAVFYDYSTDRGVLVMDRSSFRRHWGDLRPTSLTVYLDRAADPDAVRARLLATLGERHGAFIHTNASLRTEVLRIFDSTFTITYALEAIAILVAILGVTATLATLVIERRPELAMLRLVGAGRAQVRRMVMIEAGLLGLVSQVLGVIAGLSLAVLLIYVINVQSFGWTIQFHVPVGFLLQVMAVLLAATTLAGLYPARLAARDQPVEQVETE